MKIASKPGPTWLLDICDLCSVLCALSSGHCPLVRSTIKQRSVRIAFTVANLSLAKPAHRDRETLRHETFGMFKDIFGLEFS